MRATLAFNGLKQFIRLIANNIQSKVDNTVIIYFLLLYLLL